MSASLSNGLGISPSLKINEEASMITEKHGIVSILGSDCHRGKASSLRRTLSADMSSKKWLAQQGFSQMKKIASSQQFPVSVAEDSSSSSDSSSEEEKEEVRKPGQMDLWSSILSQNKKDEESSKELPVPEVPYIHPLVKRSASALSIKSLEICTESLGSETGSDVFSSYPPSENSDVEEEPKAEEQQQQQEVKVSQPFDTEEVRIVKYKKLPIRSFPPPLPSLSRQDGPSLQMKSHRKDGRLVLEAVSVDSQNYFLAQREQGRLRLTIAASEKPSHEYEEMIAQEEENKEVFDGVEFIDPDDEEAENVEKRNGGRDTVFMVDQFTQNMMLNKLIRLANRNPNPTWPKQFNMEEEEQIQLAKSFPTPPRVTRMIPTTPVAPPAKATTFNAYEYCWRRTNPTAAAATTAASPLIQQPSTPGNNDSMFILSAKNSKANEQQQQLVLLRGNKGDYLVPMLRSCKEPRRSLLFWEPYCIATS